MSFAVSPLFGDPNPEPLLPVPLTERHMLDLLHARYSAVAMNARRWAVAEHVADQTSWARRRADFIAQDCHQGTERGTATR